MGVGDFSGFVFDCGESVYGDVGAGWRKTRCGGDEALAQRGCSHGRAAGHREARPTLRVPRGRLLIT
jgi:hypothetical protein